MKAAKAYAAAKRAAKRATKRAAIVSADPIDLNEVNMGALAKAPQEELPDAFYSDVESAGLGESVTVSPKKKKKRAN